MNIQIEELFQGTDIFSKDELSDFSKYLEGLPSETQQTILDSCGSIISDIKRREVLRMEDINQDIKEIRAFYDQSVVRAEQREQVQSQGQQDTLLDSITL